MAARERLPACSGGGVQTMRERGNVGNIMITGILTLAMTVIMLAFLDNMQMIQQKA